MWTLTHHMSLWECSHSGAPKYQTNPPSEQRWRVKRQAFTRNNGMGPKLHLKHAHVLEMPTPTLSWQA